MHIFAWQFGYLGAVAGSYRPVEIPLSLPCPGFARLRTVNWRHRKRLARARASCLYRQSAPPARHYTTGPRNRTWDRQPLWRELGAALSAPRQKSHYSQYQLSGRQPMACICQAGADAVPRSCRDSGRPRALAARVMRHGSTLSPLQIERWCARLSSHSWQAAANLYRVNSPAPLSRQRQRCIISRVAFLAS